MVDTWSNVVPKISLAEKVEFTFQENLNFSFFSLDFRRLKNMNHQNVLPVDIYNLLIDHKFL